MQSSRKTPETKVRTKKSTQDDLPTTKPDEKVKKSVYSVSTPRNYIPKSSTADIYARKKPVTVSKRVPTTPRSNESPMKDLLKSSPSTISQMSSKSSRQKFADLKSTPLSTSRNTPRRLASSNVTVNSPVVKRRLNLDMDKDTVKIGRDKREAMSTKHSSKDLLPGRQRTKTRTLEDDEVKILTPEAIDNNTAMQDLSRKLTAQPKAFYVDLDEKPKGKKVREMEDMGRTKKPSKSSEEDEFSYEDDFESYESDFDSYHSEGKSDETLTQSEETSGEDDDQMHKIDDGDESEANHKEVKDEEKMLDSGNFDLRESQRSASRKPVVMDFILEGSEASTDDKKVSLTDEGFQEMSSSSAVSSMKIVHTEVLERPLFIDFAKSKKNKRKRNILERLQQRAKDILSIVTLHEMSYSLFEMKPIPYDLYMATFGRKNYTQTAVQTFEDGITQGLQTDDVLFENKWSQFPVEFTKSDIITNHDTDKKHIVKNEDFIFKFDYLIDKGTDERNISVNEEYKNNPLKIFLEQKEGAGSDKMLPEEVYKAKLKDKDFNVNKLRKFLKKSERRFSSILSSNAGNTDTFNFVKKSNLSFSKGYLGISTEMISDEKFNFLKYAKIIGVGVSETKDNLILTYHKIAKSGSTGTYVCLWDTSDVRCELLKILKSTDNVRIGRHIGNTNGLFAAALEDRTLHVWDLSEEPTWCKDVASIGDENASKLVEVEKKQMTAVELDREWNLRNSKVGYDESQKSQIMMQVSAYTSSAVNMTSKDFVDNIVALEFIGDQRTSQDGGRKIVAQICTLQRIGILLIWSITQDKTNAHDIGKAFWSKIKLEKTHSVNLSDHVDATIDIESNFNLNAAKRRLANRKQERAERRKDLTRPRSAILKNIDRPNSVSSPRKNLPISRNVNAWDSGIICNHLKVLRLNKTDHYLVANSNGEVLCCKRNLRDFKVDHLYVTSDKSSITRLEVTYSNLPYFLAATDAGTINLCSILDARVLLTLDCRNGPPVSMVKCQADHKGRFIATVSQQSPIDVGTTSRYNNNLSVRWLSWSPTNPFSLAAVSAAGVVVTWELTHSDIYPRSVVDCDVIDAASSRCSCLVLLTKEGEVQIHRQSRGDDEKSSIDLFKKYVALL